MTSQYPTDIYENDTGDQVYITDGAYSKIYDTANKNERIITKKIDRHQTTSLNRENHVRREVIVMKKIDHENCVRFIEYSDRNENYHEIKMEKCPGENLYTILTEKLVPEHLIPYFQVKVCLDCISALNAVRQKIIMNRDIKCSNIVVNITSDFQVTVKMIDFGEARFAIHDAISVVGTYGYMAPEIYFGKKIYTDICDCWSLGVVFYQIFSYKHHNKRGLCFPFRGKFIPEIKEDFHDIYEKYIWEDGISLNVKEVQEPFRILIRGLLNPDPSKRMDMVQATEILLQQFDKIQHVLHSEEEKDMEYKRLYECHTFEKHSAFRKESIKTKLKDLSILYKVIYEKITILINREDLSEFTSLIELVLNLSKEITSTMELILEKMEEKVSTLKKWWTNELHEIFLPVMTCKQYLQVYDQEKSFSNYLQRIGFQPIGKIKRIETPIRHLIREKYPDDGEEIIDEIHRLLKIS